MAKIYLLTQGEYSSYGVVGVFSTLEKAEAAKVELSESISDVEEYEIDGLVGYITGRIYEVAIRKDSGALLFGHERTWPRFRHPEIAVVSEDEYRFCVASPVSIEHATKVAAEKRQEWLRLRAAGG